MIYFFKDLVQISSMHNFFLQIFELHALQLQHQDLDTSINCVGNFVFRLILNVARDITLPGSNSIDYNINVHA